MYILDRDILAPRQPFPKKLRSASCWVGGKDMYCCMDSSGLLAGCEWLKQFIFVMCCTRGIEPSECC